MKEPWGWLASRLAKFVNSFDDPNSPGLTKSKMDHKSPSRFSTGVPVSASRAPAFSFLTARVCLRIRILDGLRFVQHRQTPGDFRNPRHAKQRAVAGDDQIHILKAFLCESLKLRRRQRGRMRDQRLQSRREAFHFRRPVRQQRSRCDQQARLRFRAGLALENQQQRKHLNGLAESHVVGQACTQAEFGQEIKPPHAHLLVGPQGPFQRIAGIDLRQPLRAAQPLQGLRQPGAGDHLRPVGVGYGRIFRGDVRAGKQPHRFAEAEAVLTRGALDLVEALDHASQVFADRPRSSARGPARVHPIGPAAR